jgi:hypothetical protein
MAAITTTVSALAGEVRVRTATAQATTGQTDWIAVPKWARYAKVYLNLTAVSGNTPICTLSLRDVVPGFTAASDDSYVINLAEHTALTGITAASILVVDVGPGVTGIADDVTNAAAASSRVAINAVLPTLLGIKILNDRTTGDETYTYTLDIVFRA